MPRKSKAALKIVFHVPSFFRFIDGISNSNWNAVNLYVSLLMLYCIFLLQTVYFTFTPPAPQECQRLPLLYTVGTLLSIKAPLSRIVTVAAQLMIDVWESPVFPLQLLQNCCFWIFRLSHEPSWHHLWLPASLSLSRYLMAGSSSWTIDFTCFRCA